jgi:hypothetical protein
MSSYPVSNQTLLDLYWNGKPEEMPLSVIFQALRVRHFAILLQLEVETQPLPA